MQRRFLNRTSLPMSQEAPSLLPRTLPPPTRARLRPAHCVRGRRAPSTRVGAAGAAAATPRARRPVTTHVFPALAPLWPLGAPAKAAPEYHTPKPRAGTTRIALLCPRCLGAKSVCTHTLCDAPGAPRARCVPKCPPRAACWRRPSLMPLRAPHGRRPCVCVVVARGASRAYTSRGRGVRAATRPHAPRCFARLCERLHLLVSAPVASVTSKHAPQAVVVLWPQAVCGNLLALAEQEPQQAAARCSPGLAPA